MQPHLASSLALLLLGFTAAFAEPVRLAEHRLEPVGIDLSLDRATGRPAARVVKDAAIREFDAPTFARVQGSHFRNGTIEVKVLSRLTRDAPEFARGFIGVAFRINDDNSAFESIYIRPTNGRAADPVRRRRAVQYFAYPDFRFERLRQESPGLYETSADIGLHEWITLRIEVKDRQARLFLNGQSEPTLVVNELKLGPAAAGAVGLWVDVGTEGGFTDLRIQPE